MEVVMQESEISELFSSMVGFVKENYHKDKVAILAAINEFCLENDIDYDVDYDEYDADDDVDPTFYVDDDGDEIDDE
jgi:hypothetical protein